MSRPRRGNDIFLDHRAAEIVAAVLQRQLTDLGSHRDPGRLQVLDVIQHDAADRHRFQIGFRRLTLRLEIRVVRLERPRDEGQEPFRRIAVLEALILCFTDAQ
ncbi:hypothetical protein D1872_295070 [compost metagenome]